MDDEQFEELMSLIYVQTGRMLDTLYLIADKSGVDVKGLKEIHENGGLLSPVPRLEGEEDVDGTNEL